MEQELYNELGEYFERTVAERLAEIVIFNDEVSYEQALEHIERYGRCTQEQLDTAIMDWETRFGT